MEQEDRLLFLKKGHQSVLEEACYFASQFLW